MTGIDAGQGALSPFAIDFPEGCLDDDHGRRWSLYLDPERRRVSLFQRVGSGCPEAVWHGRALLIPVPGRADGDSLRQIVEDHRDVLDAIADCYLGDGWNGHNRVGGWRETRDEDYVAHDHDALVDQLEEALAEVATCWRWDDWIQAARQEVERQAYTALAQGKSPDDVAADFASEGAPEHLLDEAEILDWVTERADELDAYMIEARSAAGDATLAAAAGDRSGPLWIEVELAGEETEWFVQRAISGVLVPCGDSVDQWADARVLERFGTVATREIALTLLAACTGLEVEA